MELAIFILVSKVHDSYIFLLGC